MDSALKSFDVWTEAQGLKAKGRVKSIENISLEGIARLRELILELAVRGKLVEQDPNDEPAAELVKTIEAERKQLIKLGKLKSQGVYPKVLDNEKPFSLPPGWQFVRFGNVTFNRDAERIPLSVEERSGRKGEYDYYGASGVIDKIDNYIFDKPLLLIGEDGANLINRSTPIAFIAQGKYWVNNHAHVIDGISEDFLNYLCLHINAISLLPYITGTAQPKMNQAKMNSIVLALPPLSEQHRIVAKVAELMALCDRLEAQKTASLKTHQSLVKALLQTLTAAPDADSLHEAWQRLAPHFDTLFCTEDSIDQLKQTILQLAVMGRLVRQNPTDEPASALLKRIQKEKQKLVEAGVLKKEKSLPPIGEDEKPFALPEGWEWVRWKDITNWITYGFTRPVSHIKSGIPIITGKNVKDEKIIYETADLMSVEEYNQLNEKDKPKFGDILVTKDGTIGRAAVVETNEPLCINQSVAVLWVKDKPLNKRYLLNVIISPYTQALFLEKASGVAIKHISVTHFGMMLCPIPPLSEQNRIVAKVEELFRLCDSLRQRLAHASEIQATLSKTIVENAVA